MSAFLSALLSFPLSITGAASIAPISTLAFHRFISHLSESVHQSLANSHPWWELITHSAFSRPDSIFEPTSYIHKNLLLLREHLVPSLFSLPCLSKLAFSTKLETASPGHYLTIISSSASTALHPRLIANSSDVKIFIDGIEVTHPDLFNDGHFVIHSIDGFVAPLSPLSCRHGDPHPTFALELATVDFPTLPRSQSCG